MLLRLALYSVMLSLPSFALAGNVSSGPTYAPGGHAIIPTAPAQTNAAPRSAPVQTYIAPSTHIGSSPPAINYAPGGHAIIPTLPQAPTATFNAGPSNRPSSQPTAVQSSGAQLGTARPALINSPSGVSSPSQSMGNQSGQVSVGQIPPPTPGRLQLTPIISPSIAVGVPPTPTSERLQFAPAAKSSNAPPTTPTRDQQPAYTTTTYTLPYSTSAVPPSVPSVSNGSSVQSSPLPPLTTTTYAAPVAPTLPYSTNGSSTTYSGPSYQNSPSAPAQQGSYEVVPSTPIGTPASGPTYAPSGHAIIPTTPASVTTNTAPAAAPTSTYFTTPSGAVVNAATGQLVSPPPANWSSSAIPTPLIHQNPSQSAQGAQQTYTFSRTNDGTVQVFQNGKLTSTTTAKNSVDQYGYAPANAGPSSTAPVTSAVTTTSSSTEQLTTGQNIQKAIASPAGQTLIGSLNAVGDAAAHTVTGTPGMILQVLETAKSGADFGQALKNGTLVETGIQSGLTTLAVSKAMQLGAQTAYETGAANGMVAGPTVAATAFGERRLELTPSCRMRSENT